MIAATFHLLCCVHRVIVRIIGTYLKETVVGFGKKFLITDIHLGADAYYYIHLLTQRIYITANRTREPKNVTFSAKSTFKRSH